VAQLRDIPADKRAARLDETLARVSARRVTSRYLDPEVSRREVEEMAERRGDAASLLAYVDDRGSEVGGGWIGGEGDELVVNDMLLDQLELATELVPLLVERARAGGMRMIGIGVLPGDAAHEAVAACPGFSVRATNMVLDLGPDLPGTGELTTRPMSAEEYERFMAGEVEGFAEELASAGMELEQALERSRTMMGDLLPSGMESPGMEFLVGEVGGEPVGDLWLSTGDTMAFVYNIVVRPEQRRRGYGAAVMNAAAIRCRELGHPVLGLNVFAHNPNARALYDKLGYRVTHDYFVLDLPDGG
jgi:GNAT superfamily N-acetyltransferase